MTSISSQQRWENGVPLRNAWIEFALPESRSNFDRVPEPIEIARQHIEQISTMGILRAISSGFEANKSRNELIGEMRNHLLGELSNSRLHAFAFRLYPNRSTRPVRVDAMVFGSAQVDWDSSTIQCAGLSFIQVRICDPQALENVAVKTVAKGSVRAIDEAIRQLKSEDFNFCDLPRKIACQSIRDKIGVSEIVGNGMTDQNIAKRILKQCPKRSIVI